MDIIFTFYFLQLFYIFDIFSLSASKNIKTRMETNRIKDRLVRSRIQIKRLISQLFRLATRKKPKLIKLELDQVKVKLNKTKEVLDEWIVALIFYYQIKGSLKEDDPHKIHKNRRKTLNQVKPL